MKIVSAYRYVEPSDLRRFHREMLGKFDWLEALRLLRASAAASAQVDVFAITNQELPLPSYRYATTEAQLMLWILEVSALYLASKDFDQDTVFISPDCLVCGKLDLFGGFDIGVIARPEKFQGPNKLLNAVQFWPVASREKLSALYREALALARTLSPQEQRWGADTLPLIQLLGPIEPGSYQRSGLRVKIFESESLLSSFMGKDIGRAKVTPRSRIVDFRYNRKLHMVDYYRRVFA